MINSYGRAYTEVLEILNYFPVEEYSKIPKEKIEFFEKNKDPNYDFHINPSEQLLTQNISRKAKAVILTLFRDYFANDSQKKVLKNLLKENEKKMEQEKIKKYSDVNNIFRKK